MWTKAFWKQTVERAVKTGGEVAASLLLVDGAGVLPTSWYQFSVAVGISMLASVFASLGSLKIGPAQTPSLVD